MGLPAISLWFVLMYKTHSLPDFGCSCISMTDVKGFLGSPYRRGGEEMNGEYFFYSWSSICKSAIKWNGVSFTRFFFFINIEIHDFPIWKHGHLLMPGIHFTFHIMCNHKNIYWEKIYMSWLWFKKEMNQNLVSGFYSVKMCTLFTPVNCIKKRLIIEWFLKQRELKSLSFFCVFSALHTSFDLTTFLFFP